MVSFYKFANGTKFRNDRLNRIFAKSLPRIIQTLQQHDYKIILSSKLSVEKSDFATLMKVIREQQILKKRHLKMYNPIFINTRLFNNYSVFMRRLRYMKINCLEPIHS
jgi:hypothetical protein